MRPAQPSTRVDGITSKSTTPCPKPTSYLCKFRYSGADFVCYTSGYTRDGAAALALELLRGEDGFDPQYATLVEMEVLS